MTKDAAIGYAILAMSVTNNDENVLTAFKKEMGYQMEMKSEELAELVCKQIGKKK